MMGLPLSRDQIVREVKLDALKMLEIVAGDDAIVWTWAVARRAGLMAGTMHARMVGYLECKSDDDDAEMRVSPKGLAYLKHHRFRLEIRKLEVIA